MRYAGGYLLHEADSPPAPGALGGLLDGWTERRIGDYALRHDATWRVSQASSGDAEVLLLGLAMDVERPDAGQDDVVEGLAAGLAAGEAEFHRRLDRLSGAHVIVTRRGGRHAVLQDATGMERVAYDPTPDRPALIASHASLVAELRGYAVSELGRYWASHPLRHQGGHYFPGVETAYAPVLSLTPNTLLDLGERRVQRFWPREPLPEVPTEEIVATVARQLRNQWRWLVERGPVTVSVTAGADSRLTLASTREVAERLHFHTYWTPSNQTLVRDRDVALALTEHLGLPLDVIPLHGAPSTPAGLSLTNRALLAHLPPGHLHVRSNVLETVRGFYLRNRVNLPDRFTANKLSRLFRVGTADEFEPWFDRFCAITDFTLESKQNLHYTDLLYWEHRMGMWHSGVVQSAKALHSTYVLYNCRALLATMLGRPLEERVKALAIWALVEELWPEALDVPVVSHAAPAARA